MRRVRAIASVLAAVALVAGLAGLGGALVTARPAAAAGSCTGPLGGGQIRVVIVVDPGETGPRGPQATCLVVQSGTSGSKVLAQRASQLGLPSPRYADSGLLCGLDGFPSSGCPKLSGGSYAYWAYFNGVGGGWSYGNDNPFVTPMRDGQIMGWRYTTGSPDGQAPAPRMAPSSSLFPPLTPVTAPPPVVPTVPALPPPVGPDGGGGGSVAPGASGSTPGTTAGPGDGAVAGDGTTAATNADGTPSTDATTGSSVDGAGSSTTDDGDDLDADSEELAAAPASSSGPDASRWVGPAVAVAAMGALGVGAVTQTRRRSRTSP